jgi:hypothetical protein
VTSTPPEQPRVASATDPGHPLDALAAELADDLAGELAEHATSARHPEPAAAVEEPEEPEPTVAEMVREQLGGVRGLVESSLPLLVFILVNMATDLKPALWASVGSAVAIAGYRLIRRDSVRHALNGLAAVAIAAYIASRTGRAEDFYLVNIARNTACMLAFLISIVIRRPLVGYAWRFLSPLPDDWRSRPRLFRAFTLLSLVWGVSFAVRAGVQFVLWLAHNADALGVMSLVLGWPVFGGALALTIWYGRRALRADEAENPA